MGKSKVKNIVLISGFNLESSNRGTAALGYGSVTFLKEKKYLDSSCELAKIRVLTNKFQNGYIETKGIEIQGVQYLMNTAYISFVEYVLAIKLGIFLPFGTLHRFLKRIKLVAAINGGDGFSDIYGTKKFCNCIIDCKFALYKNLPLVILPQTLGPFKERTNYEWAKRILLHADKVFVRDDKYVDELIKMGVGYEITKDLSAFMNPEPVSIEIKPNAVGINVSGLAYSNKYRSLSGQFSTYPEIIDKLILHFREKGCPIYLIPHSYNYGNPDYADDDYEACEMVYNKLEDKTNVFFVNMNLISPQIKYIISKMSFFIGMRMHANFAAIYTNTPVFGLAYSYKFAGAFTANGLSVDQTYLINNLAKEEIPDLINKIDIVYNKLVKK